LNHFGDRVIVKTFKMKLRYPYPFFYIWKHCIC